MPEQTVVLRYARGREEQRVVALPDVLDVGHSFTLEGSEWTVVSKEPGTSFGVRSPIVLVCERRST